MLKISRFLLKVNNRSRLRLGSFTTFAIGIDLKNQSDKAAELDAWLLKASKVSSIIKIADLVEKAEAGDVNAML